jgi:hypothetical protein
VPVDVILLALGGDAFVFAGRRRHAAVCMSAIEPMPG